MEIHHQLCIAVICGGPSREAEVSRSTARGVVAALKENYQQVHLIELDQNIDIALRRINPDVVFPAVHGKWGEDGILQGLLTIGDYAYVGSEVEASVLAMDKVLAKHMFQLHNLPIAKEVVVSKKQNLSEAAQLILNRLGARVVIKPACEGSGLGVNFTEDLNSIEQGLKNSLQFGERVLVEERIVGAEITVAVLDLDQPQALPIIEITTPPGTWYDYKHRYTPGWSEHIIPAPLPERQYLRTQEIAILAHQALGCRDLSRIDFVVPKIGEPILLEVNTMPGMTPTSLFPDAAKAAGISFAQLVSALIEKAAHRKKMLINSH